MRQLEPPLIKEYRHIRLTSLPLPFTRSGSMAVASCVNELPISSTRSVSPFRHSGTTPVYGIRCTGTESTGSSANTSSPQEISRKEENRNKKNFLKNIFLKLYLAQR